MAATRGAAECCRIEGDTGTIEAGKRADLIAVDGNPLAEITALERVTAIVKNGELLAEITER